MALALVNLTLDKRFFVEAIYQVHLVPEPKFSDAVNVDVAPLVAIKLAAA